MSESLTIYRLLKKDPRFPIEAYQFVREGLSFATEVLEMGKQASNAPADAPADAPTKLEKPSDLEISSSEFQMQIDMLAGEVDDDEDGELSPNDPLGKELDEFLEELENEEQSESSEESEHAHHEGQHLTGQELCDALRRYALQQYGYMAKSVLEQWGIRSTQDFGSIVYNMIEIGLMRKSPDDRREHFDNVYDFHQVFIEQFRFTSQAK